jgi:excinuclease ABC subunit B
MNITPESIKSQIKDILGSIYEADYYEVSAAAEEMAVYEVSEETLKDLEAEMKEAAQKLDFERAAQIRDKIKELRSRMLEVGAPQVSAAGGSGKPKRKQSRKPQGRKR